MRKKKKIKTIIVEKYKYNDDDYLKVEPALMLKLLEFAREEANSDEQLHSVLARMHLMSHDDECLDMEDYQTIITEPVMIAPVVTSVETPTT